MNIIYVHSERSTMLENGEYRIKVCTYQLNDLIMLHIEQIDMRQSHEFVTKCCVCECLYLTTS